MLNVCIDCNAALCSPLILFTKDLPIRAWQEHTREVFSVDWSNIKKDTFASSSWDGTVKLVQRYLTQF